ncbi:MAG: hypothetical protein ACLSBD_12865 [Blautia massiliensis (ex Durand et al. 2017)]
MANAELFTSARESALQIVHKLKDIPPFSYLDEKADNRTYPEGVFE